VYAKDDLQGIHFRRGRRQFLDRFYKPLLLSPRFQTSPAKIYRRAQWNGLGQLANETQEMKCENCGSELVGAAIVCRQCNHNNAQGRVSQWRARRTGDLQKPPSSPTRTISPLPEPPKLTEFAKPESPKPSSRNSKPLEPIKPAPMPFEPKIQINHAPPMPAPKAQARSQPESGPTAEVEQYPPWRAQLKEKVKQARERKTVGANALDDDLDEAELDPNPIVESALKRIQWAKHTPAANSAPRIVRHGSGAAALAAEEDFDSEVLVEPESKPAPQPGSKIEPAAESRPGTRVASTPTPTPTNPLLARKTTTQPVTPSETKPLPPRPQREAATTNRTQPTLPITQAEARIEIRPEAKPAPPAETVPVAEAKVAEPKPRVTGEIKPPVPQTTPTQSPSGSLAPPIASAPRTPVSTEVVGLPRTTGSLKAAKSRPATLWLRTLAGACDFVVMEVAYLPLFYSYATLNTSLSRESFTILFFLLATLTFCYQLLMIAVAGRTTGMACLNLQLVNVAGGDAPISNTQKFARAVAATAAFLLPPLNLIVMQSNQQRYTLPDLLSGTTLVEK
jgi:uncharacterized RDD family membrane protein YckC